MVGIEYNRPLQKSDTRQTFFLTCVTKSCLSHNVHYFKHKSPLITDSFKIGSRSRKRPHEHNMRYKVLGSFVQYFKQKLLLYSPVHREEDKMSCLRKNPDIPLIPHSHPGCSYGITSIWGPLVISKLTRTAFLHSV